MSPSGGTVATRRLTAEARRAQLLSVAREVFAEDGYPGAAMEKIAQRAGVTKPVLYQHFEGKKELYLALLDSDMSRLLAQVSGAIESAHDNPSRIRKGLAAYFNYIEANVDSFRLLFRETMGADPEFRESIDRFHDAAATRIGAIISDETGKSLELAELLARGIMGMSEAAATWWLDRKQEIEKAELVESLAELAWRGLAALPRRKEDE
ncbi:MAG: TetR/AcrR family transcriptional regulator [Actinobacteria bacterium]|nr:MAG: TetR/AcrR family transcriptional regulator [Actinomycetota bacterium]